MREGGREGREEGEGGREGGRGGKEGERGREGGGKQRYGLYPYSLKVELLFLFHALLVRTKI